MAIAGMGVAGALAAATAVAGIVGVLPGSSGPHGASAKPRCERVIVQRRVRQPYFVHDRSGNVRVRYRFVLEPRPITRCR